MPLLDEQNGVYRFGCFSPGVTAAFSGRRYPRAKFGDFLKAAGLDSRSLTLVHQIHSPTVLFVSAAEKLSANSEADGLLTDDPALVIGIKTADCLPVFLEDPVRRVAGLAHAGWRGLQAGILSNAVRAMQTRWGSQPKDLKAAIGPAIRGCCYEVGSEFQAYFPRHFKPGRRFGEGPGGMLDLAAGAVSGLLEMGLSDGHIMDCGICTACENDRFFSFRKDKTNERILSVMALWEP